MHLSVVMVDLSDLVICNYMWGDLYVALGIKLFKPEVIVYIYIYIKARLYDEAGYFCMDYQFHM